MIFRLFLFSALMLSFPCFWDSLSKGFRLGKLLYGQTAAESVQGIDPSSILSQPFSYFSHGGESFVFASQDGRYVLKLFRRPKVAHPWRLFLRDQVLQRKKRLISERRIERLFTASKIAYEKASDLTGLVYLHLYGTAHEKLPILQLQGPCARKYTLDLNRTAFAIQLRAKPIYESFQEAILANDREKFGRLCFSFASLLQERASRGIRNEDTKVSLNFGFLGEKAIEWDFGNYTMGPTFHPKREVDKFLNALQQWIHRKFPEWDSTYQEERRRSMQQSEEWIYKP